LRYVSTRGEAKPLLFEDALLAGLARDGGLYLPEAWPKLSPSAIADLAGRTGGSRLSRVPFLEGILVWRIRVTMTP
jgi:threonine synthase